MSELWRWALYEDSAAQVADVPTGGVDPVSFTSPPAPDRFSGFPDLGELPREDRQAVERAAAAIVRHREADPYTRGSPAPADVLLDAMGLEETPGFRSRY